MGNFADDLKKFGSFSMDKVDKVRRASAMELFMLIIESTPVESGMLRNNWRTQLNAPLSAIRNSADKDGKDSINEAAGNLGKADDTIFFSNNLPYAEAIEYDGHSQYKAPGGMVRINVARWDEIVRAKAEAYKK